MKLISAFLACLSIFSAPALALTEEAVSTKILNTHTAMTSDGWSQQCVFEFNRWIGKVYVKTVTLHRIVEEGTTSSKVMFNDMLHLTDGCPENQEKRGFISARIDGRLGAQLFTGDLPWTTVDNNLEAHFQNAAISSCAKAIVRTNSWCQTISRD